MSKLRRLLIQGLNDKRTMSGSTVALQWLYSGSTVALQRTKDEQKTNKRRTMNEDKVKIR
ncbi:hypothetical protein HW278_10880 [Capnocytophaga sp. oral taxon 902]|uniref:hypothetical protein n=1 Tax=Capnocytophaga sp. oral taxon 902 TaxID=2748316 RepID=UPI0015BF7F98|nr:hypothetical protein [Capnocytophaga sp. oral taxon 902]QLF51160.1 hypothetical protein HW278_10880 [Capnocytophaga sp. oral taxon 902]